MFNRFAAFLLFASILSSSLMAQIPLAAEQFKVFDAAGSASQLDKIIDAAATVDVLFLGEQHDDAVAHAVQLEILRRVYEQAGKQRNVILSLEMFERDTQLVVDEYLANLISETHFMTSSRAWPNYKTDYKPLVDFAKANKLTVVAANAPRRYVNMVSRGGRESLRPLSSQAKAWLAPLPFGEPSEAYTTKFKSLMGGSGEARMGLDNILASQSLWDATMADSIAKSLRLPRRPLVIHLNGSFHSESRLGTVEHLLRYRPKAKAVVVTMRYEKDFGAFDKARHERLGDFVILTDAAVPRSRR